MYRKEFFILFIMSLAVFMVCIEYTGIVIAIPAMTKSFGLTINEIQWCMTGYLLSFSSIIIIGGHLGDIYQNRIVLIIGLLVFVISSLIIGVSYNGCQVILARILQGVGAALIWPNATAIAFNSAPLDKKAFAIGVVTGVVGFSMAVAPLLAGYLSDMVSWRWFF